MIILLCVVSLCRYRGAANVVNLLYQVNALYYSHMSVTYKTKARSLLVHHAQGAQTREDGALAR
jgi:hypothetical protein